MLKLVTVMSRRAKQGVLLGLDMVLVPLALAFALAVQSSGPSALDWLGAYAVLTAILMLLAAALAHGLGIPRIQLKSYEITGAGRSAVMAVVLAAALMLADLVAETSLPQGTAVTFGLLFLVLAAVTRVVLLQVLLWVYRHARPASQVLIYGAGTTGMQLALALKPHAGLRVVAFIDDNKVLHDMRVAGRPVYPPQKLTALIASRRIDRVLLAMPSLSQPRQAQIARRIANLGVEVQALPSFSQLAGQERIVDRLAPVLPQTLLGRKALDGALKGACSAYRGRSVLISGAGGSIGSELCRQILTCAPARLVLLELSEFALYTIERELRALAEGESCEIIPVLGTVTDRRQVHDALTRYRVDVVLHAAAYKHVPLVEANPLAGIANNVLGTATLAEAARDCGVGRFILVSTDKAVRPRGMMGATKRLAELVVCDLADQMRARQTGVDQIKAARAPADGKILRPGPGRPAAAMSDPGATARGGAGAPSVEKPAEMEAEIPVDVGARSGGTVFAMVRFGNVLGSSGSVIPLFQEQIARGGPITLTDPGITRYFMTLQEAAQLVLRAGTLAGRPYADAVEGHPDTGAVVGSPDRGENATCQNSEGPLPGGGEIMVLDMGVPVRIADLARQVIAAQGYSVRDAANPDGDIEIQTIGLRPGEKLHEELSSSETLLPTAHPKIFRARESYLSGFEVARALHSLRKAVALGDADLARAETLRWVHRDQIAHEASSRGPHLRNPGSQTPPDLRHGPPRPADPRG
ncbi:polysaccharide biosynthesis protein [Roseicitreum antarcticum]|nr:nucleoside-diphosphate sugar epimerase/dehydratase [Roseicitreum antarcticum]